MNILELICNKCESDNLDVKDNGPHKELYCKDCGFHVKFLSRQDYNKLMGIEEEPMDQSDLEVHPIDDYNGVAVDVYKGIFAIMSMNKGQNDVWYKKWIFWSRWLNGASKPDGKAKPLAIRLGDKTTALETLAKIRDDIQRLT